MKMCPILSTALGAGFRSHSWSSALKSHTLCPEASIKPIRAVPGAGPVGDESVVTKVDGPNTGWLTLMVPVTVHVSVQRPSEVRSALLMRTAAGDGVDDA